jgi:transcription elongation factor GreA
VIAAIAEARLHGDLSENAEYHAAKDRQGWIEGQIAEIEDKMARAQVIDVSKLSAARSSSARPVSVVDEDTEEEARYQIVGEHEADVKRGRVSITSPIARAIIGKENGDVVEVITPSGGQGLRDHQGGVGLTRPRWPDARVPLRIWAVSDGRAGIEAQALGLAEAVARLRPAHIAVKRIGWRSAWAGCPGG